MSRITDLVTRVQDHWQHELSKAVKVIAETGRERNALRDELEQVHATLTAAMEGRQWQLERAVQAEAKVERLRAIVYDLIRPAINATGESWLFDPKYADHHTASILLTFGVLRRARRVFPEGMFRYANPANHRLVPACGVKGCRVAPEDHPLTE